jgi:hypothetical protein
MRFNAIFYPGLSCVCWLGEYAHSWHARLFTVAIFTLSLAGVIAPVREDLQDAGAFHLAEVAAIAGPLHIVMAAVIHLMLLGMLCLCIFGENNLVVILLYTIQLVLWYSVVGSMILWADTLTTWKNKRKQLSEHNKIWSTNFICCIWVLVGLNSWVLEPLHNLLKRKNVHVIYRTVDYLFSSKFNKMRTDLFACFSLQRLRLEAKLRTSRLLKKIICYTLVLIGPFEHRRSC